MILRSHHARSLLIRGSTKCYLHLRHGPLSHLAISTLTLSRKHAYSKKKYFYDTAIHRRQDETKIYSTHKISSSATSQQIKAFFTSSSTLCLQDRNLIEGPHGHYLTEYNQSIQNPESFWYEASKDLHWFKQPSKEQTLTAQRSNSNADVLHPGLMQWFADGEINICYNCLDRHVNDNKKDNDNNNNTTALIYDSPLTQTKETYTYEQLLNLVSQFAYELKNKFDVQIGDRVVIYMPMIPQAIIAMLACARIGAVHSVVFGGFASHELASRIMDCKPKVVISANGGIEPGNRIVDYKKLLDEALEMVNIKKHHDSNICSDEDNNTLCDIKSIIVRRNEVNNGQCTMIDGRDYCYKKIMNNFGAKSIDAIPLPSTHPNYILYTSGTTGKPKGVLRDTGSHAVALQYSMKSFYDTKPGEVFFAASDIGWVVGHSYIVYGPLLQGCTTVLYEGKPVGTPDAGALWRIVQEYKVKTLFTAPTAIRAIKQADPNGELIKKYDLSSFKTLFLAGERTDPGTLKYCDSVLAEYDIPVIDHWWQTELGWPAIGNAIGLGRIPTKYGACAAPVPGFKFDVFNDEGQPVPSGILGNLVIQMPLPPGALVGLYQNNERYIKDYLLPLDGYYMTGDSAIIDDNGYVHIMSRTDDIINTAGHRLSTGAMEEILLSHNEVGDCAVIGIKDELKGQIPIGFVVTNANSQIDHNELCKDLIQKVRQVLGPVASFKKVAVVEKLPKTRSGKILRGTMVKIANGENWTMPPTVEDAGVFDLLIPKIKNLSS